MADPVIVVRGRADFSQISRALRSVGRNAALGLGGLSVAAAAVAKSAVDVEAEFSKSLRLVAANTDATTKQLGKLEKQATTLGPSLGFGARESADAMLELAKAGLDTKQILGGGFESTLRLASAGATSLATASTIGANALNSFGLKASEMDQITVALAGGANASTASVESLGTALSQVGPGARTAGLSLQETVAVLSAFDNAGIKGSDAGTSLKTMLTRLVPQTKKARDAMRDLGLDFTKADGSFQSIEQVAQQLQDRLGGLTAEQRTTALATIFGSDATRAATVLAREGAKGLGKYIKATRDRSAAEKAVKAQTEGSAGALKRLSASVEGAQLKLGKALAPAAIVAADAISSRLVPATETAIDIAGDLFEAYKAGGFDGLVDEIDDLVGAQGNLGPIADEAKDAAAGLLRVVQELAPAFLDATSELTPFLSPLGLAGDIANGLADALDAIPDPLKSIGIQAALAAAILPRLTTAAATAGGAMAVATTRAVGFSQALGSTGTAAQTRALSQLGGAARTAGGVGGLLALSAGAQQADRSTGILLTTVGGAATGFAVGGPWGALVGGAAGAALGVFSHKADDAGDSAEQTQADVAALAGTLDQLTGSTTASTKAFVYDKLERAGILDTLQSEGLARRTVVDAIFGERDAQREVAKFTADQESQYKSLGEEIDALNRRRGELASGDVANRIAPLERERASIRKVIDTLAEQREQLQATVADERLKAVAVQNLAALYGKLPKRVVTKLDDSGIVPTTRGIARVIRQYNLVDKRQIRAVIAATGVQTTVKDVQKVANQLKQVDKTRVELGEFRQSFTRHIGDFREQAGRGGKEIGKRLHDGTKGAQPNLRTFQSTLSSNIATAKGVASAGSTGIGSNMKTGFGSGFAGADGLWSGQVRGAVRSAINAGRAEAGIKSPSRETGYIGDMMGKGLVDKLDAYRGKVKNAGRSLIASLLAGMGSGSDEVSSTLDKLTAFIEKRIEMKDSKKEKARERSVLKDLRDQYDALRKIGKAQDLLVSGNFLGSLKKGSRLYKQMTELGVKNLTEARDKLRSLKQEAAAYAANIKDSFVSFGSVLGLGANEDGTVSTSQLIDQLKNRLQTAKRFAALIKSFRDNSGPKLNATTLQQLLDAGPEAAIATAEAIAAGGSSAVTQINDLTHEIATAGGSLGSTMATEFKQAGINMAAALVAQLEKEKRRLDKVADRLGDRLVDRVQHLLGIKGGGGGPATPSGSQRVALRADATDAAPQSFSIRFTAEQVTDLQAGRATTARVDLVSGYGKRTLATAGRR